MVVDVEVFVVDPDRPGLVVRHLHHTLAQTGHAMDPPGDVRLELVEPNPPTGVA